MTTEAAMKAALDTHFFTLHVDKWGKYSLIDRIVPADYVPRHGGPWVPGGDGSQKKIKARQLTDAEFDDIQRMRADGCTWTEIASKHSASHSRMSEMYHDEWRKRNPETAPPKTVRHTKRNAAVKKWTKAEERALWTMCLNLDHIDVIAQRLGRTRFSIEAKRAAMRDRIDYEAKHRAAKVLPVQEKPEVMPIMFTGQKVTMRSIVKAVSIASGVPQSELMSDRRDAEISNARHVVFYLARHLLNASYPQIGNACKRDHSTVMYGVASVEKNAARYDKIVRMTKRLLNVRDAELSEAA